VTVPVGMVVPPPAELIAWLAEKDEKRTGVWMLEGLDEAGVQVLEGLSEPIGGRPVETG
jgi:hypothetical protein